MLEPGYHWKNGWHFYRMVSGTVQIKHPDQSGALRVAAEIPPYEWASIVAEVACGGGTAAEYEKAAHLHVGQEIDPNQVPAPKPRRLRPWTRT